MRRTATRARTATGKSLAEQASPCTVHEMMNEWRSAEHASAYLERADSVPFRSAGEQVLVEELPSSAHAILDLGSGDGRLLDLVLRMRPKAHGVALDFSPLMLDRLRTRFAATPRVTIVEHNLDDPLPPLGTFDAVVSSFAIHHLDHARKRELYAEVWAILEPGGVFCNLEHVASASAYGHERFLEAMGTTPAEEDPSNRLLDAQTQLEWLRQIRFRDVDCYWKWRELALLVGRNPDGMDVRTWRKATRAGVHGSAPEHRSGAVIPSGTIRTFRPKTSARGSWSICRGRKSPAGYTGFTASPPENRRP
jgi:tRNA (cmo5U34)-methyltransferase